MLLTVLSVLILFLLGVIVGMIIESSFHHINKMEKPQRETEEPATQQDFFDPF